MTDESKIDARKPMHTGKWGTAFDIMRDVIYVNSFDLDLYERATLNFIFARTRFYNKQWEYIPLRHFLNGVWSKEVGCVCAPIRISEKKLLESLKHLEGKGIIEVRRAVTRSNCYRIRHDEEIKGSAPFMYAVQHQPALFNSMIKELERNERRLSDDFRKLLYAMKEHLEELKTTSTKEGTVTPHVPKGGSRTR